MVRRQIRLGVVLVLLGLLLALGLASPLVGGALVVFGVLLIMLGRWLRRTGLVVQIVNPAYDAITRGDLTRAESLLDQVEVSSAANYIQRVIALQRAGIAWRRGDTATLSQHAARAIDIPRAKFLFSTEHDSGNVLYAHSLRAVGRAAEGDLAGAESDLAVIEAAEASGEPVLPECLARAALATALVHQRRGDRAALRKHLAERRTLLTDFGIPAERALVRAMARMLRAESRSVYRDKPEERPMAAGAELATHDWIQLVAPEAAAFARPREAGEAPLASTSDNGLPAAPPAISSAGPSMGGLPVASAQPREVVPKRRVALVFALLLVLFSVLFLLMPSRADTTFVSDALLPGAGVAFLLVLFGGVAYRVTSLLRRQRAGLRALFKASAQAARGDFEGAEAELLPLSEAKLAMVAAQAWLHLAMLAERKAQWARALECCDRGVARATETEAAYVSTVDLVLPSLSGVRAAALAAMGRDAEADAELAAHHEKFPTSAYRTKIDFGVRLVQLARGGRLSEAAELVERDAESLPLPARVTLLADLVRAVGLGVGAEERLRLTEELRGDADSRAWVVAVAPQLISSFEDRRDEPVADPDRERANEAHEAEAEDEAAAELEAEAALRPVR